MPIRAIDAIAKYGGMQNQPPQQVRTLSGPQRTQRAPQNEVYTGKGPDGVAQPNRPVGMVQTVNGPRYIHEDERMRQNPDGSVRVIPSPSTQQQQAMMRNEQQFGVPGYEEGTPGFTPVTSTTGQVTVKAPQLNVQAVTPTTAVPNPPPPAPAPAPPNRVVSAHERVIDRLKSANNVPSMPGDISGGYDPTLSPAATQHDRMVQGLTGDSAAAMAPPTQIQPVESQAQQTVQGPELNVQASTPTEQYASGIPITGAPQQTVNMAGPVAVSGDNAGQVINPNQAVTSRTVDTNQQTATAGDPNLIAMQEGAGMVRDVARGQSDVSRQARDYYLNAFNAAGSAEDARMLQQLMAQGYTQQEAQAMLATRRRDRDVSRSELFAKLGIAEAERAENAAQQMVQIGQQIINTEQGMREFENFMQSETGTALAGYIQAAVANDPNYDWRDDHTAAARLQAHWESLGYTGAFDQNWADAQVGIASVPPGDALINGFKQESWYNNMPDTTTFDADGNPVEYGKDFYDNNVFPFLAMAQGMGADLAFGMDDKGNFYVADRATGESWGPGTPPNTTLGVNDDGTYDWTSDAGVTAAIDAWGEGAGLGVPGVTNDAMAQYLEANGGNLPGSEEEWNTWNMTEREFDYNDDASVDNAAQALINAGAESSTNLPSVKEYLLANGGVLGSASDYDTWKEEHGDLSAVRGFLRDPETYQLADATDRRLLEDTLIPAADLMARKSEFENDPDGWQQAIEDAGFVSEEQAQFYADQIGGHADVSNALDEYGRNLSASNPGVLEDWEVKMRGYAAKLRGSAYNVSPHFTSIDGLAIPQSQVDYMASMGGQPITVNGKTFVLAPAGEQQIYGAIQGGGHEDNYDNGYTVAPGYKAWDVTANKWVVLSPNKYKTHASSDSSDERDADYYVAVDPDTWQVMEYPSSNDPAFGSTHGDRVWSSDIWYGE